MTPDRLLGYYVLSLLAGLALVALYSELRRRRFEPTSTEDSIFRCSECGFVYTDDPDVDRSRCPQCGQMNEPFEF
jgi:rubrerythrin